MPSPDAIQRDANRVPIQGNDAFLVTKARTFTGAAGLGAQGVTTLFTVTGDVIVRVFATCSVDLAGTNATIELGIVGNTAAVIAQTVATTIDLGEVWYGTNPPTVGALPSGLILTNGTDIDEKIATADITAGALAYYCLFRPLSAGATITAA